MSYARYLKKLGLNVIAYGPELRPTYTDIAPIEYNFNISIEQLHDQFHFDLIIISTKSRCFFDYDPKRDKANGMWLPPGFAAWKRTPKVVLEEDYHYEKNDLWYQEMNINLIVQRHYSQSLRQEKVPMVFLPFSVDVSSFKDTGRYQRINKFAFMGNADDSAYVQRKKVIDILTRTGLCDNHFNRMRDNNYLDTLQKYTAYISCGSIYEIVAAKNFEIMASGGVLFTNPFQGVDLVFPPNCYVAYKNDCSDVFPKGQALLHDTGYREAIVAAGKKCIAERHTHEIRTQEMLKLFKERL